MYLCDQVGIQRIHTDSEVLLKKLLGRFQDLRPHDFSGYRILQLSLATVAWLAVRLGWGPSLRIFFDTGSGLYPSPVKVSNSSPLASSMIPEYTLFYVCVLCVEVSCNLINLLV